MSATRGHEVSARRSSRDALLKRAAMLQRRLVLVEEALSAIALGKADAIVAHGSVYTLASLDDPFRSLVEWMYDGAATLAPDGVILYCNRAFARLFGRAREDLLSHPIAGLVAPTDAVLVARTLDRASVEPVTVELKGIRGELPFPVRISISRIARSHRYAVLAEDLSEIREREAELGRSNAELQRFAYAASHDLKEPLRLVASYVELLAQRYRGRLDDDADEFIGYAVEGAARMHRMVDDLLNYAHVHTHGKAPVSTSAEQSLAAAIAALQPALEACTASVTHGPLPVVWADSAQLTTLFTIFLDNAVTHRGTAAPRVHVAARRTGAEWMFSVKDNGKGIDPAQYDQIFLLFQRPTSGGKSRTALGLAVARRIIGRHDGRLWVESELGQGSTFFFTLPVPRADAS